MKPAVPYLMWLVPAAALVLPPFLLIPLVGHLPGAQFCKDLYEACLWLTPPTGVGVGVLLYRLRRRNPDALRAGGAIAAMILAGLDLLAPVFFFVLLAVLAGH
jgi:hypothetical protein